MANGSLGQDDIDKMLAELGATDAKPAAPASPEAAPPADASPPPAAVTAEAPAAAAAPAPPPSAPVPGQAGQSSSLLDQNAIDALIAQTADALKQPVVAKTTSKIASGHLDQQEIDKLLADLDPHTRTQKAAPSASNTQLSDKDLDRLLNELDVPAGGGSSEALPATSARAGSGSKQATAATQTAAPMPAPAAPAAPAATAATVTAAPAPAPAAPVASATAAPAKEGPLSQDDIDKMLAELGAQDTSVGAEKTKKEAPPPEPQRRTIPPAPAPVEVAPNSASEATQALSPEEIDAIVAKQTAAPPGSESEAVIAQSDIDALVKQLAQATGSPEEQAVAEAIAEKASVIDRMQAAPQPPPELTADAVDVNSILGRTASTTSLRAQPMAMASVNLATVPTGEWRFAWGMLAAAVLLLALCSGALIVLTMSVTSLSKELRAAREVEHPAVDAYADKLRLALAKLAEADEAERARGVRWMEELKRQHPDHAADVGIALARHFRAREAWRRAADEYGSALEAGAAVDDPRVPLEHADCLARLGDEPGAIRQIYLLLADEARWLAERDAEGRPIAALERNRQAIADAYLVLGRLLARSRVQSPLARRDPAPSPAPAPTGHAPAAGGH